MKKKIILRLSCPEQLALDPWYLYQMVTQNMLRTQKGKKIRREKIDSFTALDLV